MKVNKVSITDFNALAAGNIVSRRHDQDGDMLVLDQAELRILTFGSIYQQSAYYPDRPFTHVHEYTRAMMVVLGFLTPRHITLLGLGGGTLLRTAHHYLPLCDFHVVERRGAVYDIAKNYFAIPNDRRVQVSIDDAMEQLERMETSSTDVIFSDLYSAFGASPVQSKLAFYRECARTLTSSGWLVINYERSPEKNAGLLGFLDDYFEEASVCECAYGNHIIFACKSSPVNDEQAQKRLVELEDTYDEPYVTLFRRLARLTD